ncbi:hypothetical protein B2J88_07880 [Rhodococcus sp. SRB_17]|nr:hypothetical protein [Rhodococcus sp. SRB_17]
MLTEFPGTFYDVMWSGALSKYKVRVYVDARFSGEFVDRSASGNYLIDASGDTLLAVLSSAYARLAVSLPVAVSA